MSRLEPGTAVAPRELETIDGGRMAVPQPEGLVHLQFRRFAGCPMCSLHLRSLVQRSADIAAAGITEVIVFHSTREELLRQQGDVRFAIVADPGKRLYREFGVESGWRSELHPRAWGPALRGALRKPGGIVSDKSGGILGLPADFLLAPDGRIVACRYGEHAYDQWSVDELLEHARAALVIPAR